MQIYFYIFSDLKFPTQNILKVKGIFIYGFHRSVSFFVWIIDKLHSFLVKK